ncbi:hypothetical protein TcasGA2_TC002548 [Tribolium castaneum]|uniref:Uncharacterized protein n=1 Tax=Tribolium castaneum TaxID=7070 RepID=D6WFZ0_TRICA|nr:hypothetical protein TcasGA2_TC002548 [Tribolium castaneum]
MHEETASMSVPGPVAVSAGQSEGSPTPTAVVVNAAEVDLEVAPDADNVELQVPFAANSGVRMTAAMTAMGVSGTRLRLVVGCVRGPRPTCAGVCPSVPGPLYDLTTTCAASPLTQCTSISSLSRLPLDSMLYYSLHAGTISKSPLKGIAWVQVRSTQTSQQQRRDRVKSTEKWVSGSPIDRPGVAASERYQANPGNCNPSERFIVYRDQYFCDCGLDTQYDYSGSGENY